MGKNKVISVETAMSYIQDGCSVMIPGFVGTGAPDTLMRAMIRSGKRHLEVISNNAGTERVGIGELIHEGMVDLIHCCHIGRNPEAVKLAVEGSLKVDFNPMGTLAERIRCGGAGLGGVLVKTGLGTMVEEGKQIIEVNGESWLLETPLHADIALIHAWKADRFGNLQFRHTANNFNEVMATAADIVLVEAEVIVSVGDIVPDDVVIPGFMVTGVIQRDVDFMHL